MKAGIGNGCLLPAGNAGGGFRGGEWRLRRDGLDFGDVCKRVTALAGIPPQTSVEGCADDVVSDALRQCYMRKCHLRIADVGIWA